LEGTYLTYLQPFSLGKGCCREDDGVVNRA
jgi:hypothetical protein